MKLVEILARELKEWPKGVHTAYQDADREVRFDPVTKHDFFCEELAEENPEISCQDGIPFAGPVTRADWQAAKDKLEGKAVKKPNANKDGWVRHRGGKCPVEAGTLVDVRLRSGAILYCTEASNIYWSRVENPNQGDVMAYKIYYSSEQPEIAEEPSPVDPVAPIAGPLQWRDRITEIDAESKAENERHSAAMTALSTERAELVQKLASEGLAMIERKAEPVEDMSDWRNWKAGDLITHVAGDWTDYTKGKQYPVKEVGAEFIKTRDDVEDRFMEVDGAYMFEDGRFPSFEWHSRPTN